MKLVYKVCLTCGIVGFVNISTDRSGTPYNLVDKYTSAFSCIHLITDRNDM